MSDGSSSTGTRLTVAVAAPVSRLVEPGPIEAVQASVESRFVARAKPIAACTIACSFFGWWKVSSRPASSSSAGPRPQTLPWPKIPKMPGTARRRWPSRSLHWQAR